MIQYDLYLELIEGKLLYLPYIPTKLSDLESDTTHRTVTDEQITKWDNAALVSEEMADYTTLIDEVNDSITYLGYGNPGTLSSINGWKIKRITITGDDVKIEYASGTKTFDKVWDDRASYSYS